MEHSEWTAVIELDRKKPFAFPELGVSIACQLVMAVMSL